MEVSNTHIEDSDRTILRKAIERQRIANEVLRFLSDHFREKYELSPGMQITPDGEIVRQDIPNGRIATPTNTE